jgi:peptide/nickel transport system permease protein
MKNQLKIAFKSGKFMVGFVTFVIILLYLLIYPLINTANPLKMITTMFAKPSAAFPLGADNFGRNEIVELAAGARTSLLIGIMSGVVATVLGLLVGLIGGYVGGLTDDILSTITNIFLVIPSFIILVLVSVCIRDRTYLTTALVIGFTSWPWTARTIRAQTVSLRNRDHVNLAKMSGYSTMKIIIRDIMPYLASYITMYFILQISSGILNEAQISMLGLGPQNTATLGLMLNWATMYEAHMSGAWWAFLPVIILISLITFSLNMMNTGLDQVFNPQLGG